MKRYLAIITVFTLTFWASAEQASKPPSNLDGFLREIDAGNMDVLEYARNFPPEDAEQILRSVINHTKMLAPEKAEMAAALMGELPGMPELFQQRLAALPHLYENSSERGLWMSDLERIHKRWALNLLAGYLFDDRPLESKYSAIKLDLYRRSGGSSAPNSILAVSSITQMCRKESLPTSKKLDFSQKDLELIRGWWRKNEHQPDSFFFSDTGYSREPTPSIKQTSIVPPTLSTSHPKSSIPTAKPLRPMEETSPSTLWIVIVVLIVIGISLLLLLLKQRTK